MTCLFFSFCTLLSSVCLIILIKSYLTSLMPREKNGYCCLLMYLYHLSAALESYLLFYSLSLPLFLLFISCFMSNSFMTRQILKRRSWYSYLTNNLNKKKFIYEFIYIYQVAVNTCIVTKYFNFTSIPRNIQTKHTPFWFPLIQIKQHNCFQHW